MSPLALYAALWFAADPSASRVDVSGGVSVELRGGVAPVRPLDPAEPGVLTIVTPDVDMEYASRRGSLFNLGYTPRVQYRSPNRLNINRPILLHQAYATYQEQLDRRWLLGVNLSGSVGETDYNSGPTVLADQTQAPDISVLNIATASGRFDLQGRLTRRHTLRIGPRIVYRKPLDVPEVDPATEDAQVLLGVPEQLNVNLELALATRLTPVDTLDVSLTPGYFDYSSGQAQFLTTEALGEWSRELRPSLGSTVGVGVFGSALVGGDADAPPPVLPVAQASLTGGLVRRASHSVDATINAGVLPYFDRVQTALTPRATLSGTVTVTIPPRWTARAIVAAVTNATAEPRTIGTPDADGNAREAIETQFRLALPVTYEIDRAQQFEFGLLSSVRAPHFASDDFAFTQLEAWLYVAYRFGAGTARGGDEVGQGNAGALTRSVRGGDQSGGRR